jgi:hypothetical protein
MNKIALSHIDDFPNELKQKCFEFFYWFSRFEFALKENGYLKKGAYDAAMPDWDKFRDRYAREFQLTDEVNMLFNAPPKRQVFNNNGSYHWEKTDLNRENTNLGKVILIIKTIRNNLFHGGKSSQDDWDNPDRNIFLLDKGKIVLDTLATLGDLDADYRRYY